MVVCGSDHGGRRSYAIAAKIVLVVMLLARLGARPRLLLRDGRVPRGTAYSRESPRRQAESAASATRSGTSAPLTLSHSKSPTRIDTAVSHPSSTPSLPSSLLPSSLATDSPEESDDVIERRRRFLRDFALSLDLRLCFFLLRRSLPDSFCRSRSMG